MTVSQPGRAEHSLKPGELVLNSVGLNDREPIRCRRRGWRGRVNEHVPVAFTCMCRTEAKRLCDAYMHLYLVGTLVAIPKSCTVRINTVPVKINIHHIILDSV